MNTKNALNNIRLSKNFRAVEFANSKDGYAIKIPNPELIDKLQQVRDIVGRINITSGYRTPSFNKKIGGSPNSNHLKGLASDIVFDFTNWKQKQLRSIFMAVGFTNVGFYYHGKELRWIHVDIGKPWNAVNGWVAYGENYREKTYQV